MKKLHKKIYAIRVAKVKKVAKQKSKNHTFTREQTKALNSFYFNEYITIQQARGEVLKSRNSKLFKLYDLLKIANYNNHSFDGYCFNEKATMILFCINMDEDFIFLQQKLKYFYITHPLFKRE